MNKTMKKILFVFIVVAGLFSCSKEDWFENIQPEINFFAVPEDATGEEADLRREFFKEMGIYLLFTDTLGIRETQALSGEKISSIQVLDFFWNMNPVDDYNTDSLKLLYYQDVMQKKVAVQFLQYEILPMVPQYFYPYSILLLDSLIRYPAESGLHGPGVGISNLSSLQNTAIACGNVMELTQEKKNELKKEISEQIIISHVGLIPDEEFLAFYEYSAEYYGIYTYDVPTPVESVGFLDTYWNSWTVTFNTKNNDKLAFIEKIFELPETEFRKTYSEYPLVIAKMEAMVKVLKEYGVNIYE